MAQRNGARLRTCFVSQRENVLTRLCQEQNHVERDCEANGLADHW